MSKKVYSSPNQEESGVVYRSLDETPTRPYNKNRRRSDQRHHSQRVRNNRIRQLSESFPQVPLESYSDKWLNGLDSHSVSCQCRGCNSRNKENKYRRKRPRDYDDYEG